MEYPKIQTLFDRDDKTHKVIPSKLRNPVYRIIKTWQFTEKIDGMNIRIIWENGKIRIGGRTDNAQIPADLISVLYSKLDPMKFSEVLKDAPVIIFGEGYGAGIQKGGGYSPIKQIAIFDVLIESYWLDWENTCDVATKLDLTVVPYLGEFTLEEAVEKVRIVSKSMIPNSNISMEGMVGRTVEPLFDKRGDRLIIKLKTRDF